MSNFDQDMYKFDRRNDLFGRGSFASVFKASLRKGFFRSANKNYPEYVAVKIMPIDKSGYSNTEADLQDFVDFNHHNIVKYFKFLIKDEGPVRCHHIYMTFCSSDLAKTLQERKGKMKPLSDREVLHLSRSMAEGLHHLHRQGLIHRDFKTSNILLYGDELDDGLLNKVPKIADFNISKLTDGNEGSLTFSAGTASYRAPEVLISHKNRYAKYGLPADVYSLGAVIFETSTLQKLVDEEVNIADT